MSSIAIPNANVTTNATTTPTGNTIVLRDSVGNITGNDVTGTNLVTTGSFTPAVSPQSSSFTDTGTATIYLVSASAAAVTVTLQSAADMDWLLWIVKTDNSSNHVNISGVSGTTALTSQYQKAMIVSDGTTIWSV